MEDVFYPNSSDCNKIFCFENTQACELPQAFKKSSALFCNNSIFSNYNGNFENDARQIESEEDAQKFLDKINWNGFVFRTCTNEENLSSNLHGNFQCSSNETNFFLSAEVCLIETGCTIEDESLLKTAMPQFVKYLYFVLGFFNLLGNFFVITNNCKYLTSSRHRYKEKTVFNILTLNLALADILIGIDVAMYAIYLAKTTSESQNHHIEISFCYVLAIFGFLSNQVSVFVLFLISAVRLYGVLRPFKHVKVKLIVGLVLLIWSFWVFLSILPFLDITASIFYFGVRNVKNGISDISFLSVKLLVKNLLAQKTLNKPCQMALNIIKKYDTPKILTKMLEKLHLVDETNSHQIGFFNKRNLVCIVNPLVEFHDPVAVLSLIILVFDLLIFVFVSVSYAIIIKKMKFGPNRFCKIFQLKKHPPDQATQYRGDRRKYLENQRMYRSILFIITTDLLIWVPILIASFIYYAMSMSESFCVDEVEAEKRKKSVYEIFTLFVLVALPINSTINPYFYSIQAWRKAIKGLKQKTANFTSISHDKNRTNNL